MLDPTKTAQLESRINMIGMALCFGVPTIGAIILWVFLEASRNPFAEPGSSLTLCYILTAFAVVEIPIALYTRKILLADPAKRAAASIVSTPETSVFNAFLISYSMIASATAYGFVIYLLSYDPLWASALFLIPPIAYLLVRARSGEIEAALERLSGTQR